MFPLTTSMTTIEQPFKTLTLSSDGLAYFGYY